MSIRSEGFIRFRKVFKAKFSTHCGIHSAVTETNDIGKTIIINIG